MKGYIAEAGIAESVWKSNVGASRSIDSQPRVGIENGARRSLGGWFSGSNCYA